VRQVLQRPQRRVGLGVGAVILVSLAVTSFYLFGIGGSGADGAVSVPTLAPTKNSTIFTIDSSASEVTFTIDEVRFSQPNTVVGKTDQVAGQIRVDELDPSQSQIGTIRVDLSTLVTDNDFRNAELQNHILETGVPANRYATFVATSVTGLPTTTAGRSLGDTVTFQITGRLTIHQVTRTVTFAAQVTAQSKTVLKGQAQTTVRYEDFDLTIPSIPSVTGVTDNVTLALTFTAHA
jgi:polyisoprenoid-binding protein YceI